MRDELKSINARLDAKRCESRIDRVGVVVDSFRFSLPHPHDFSPTKADLCWIPEVQKTIIDGTDEEFQDCEADLRSRISELSAAWLKERRNFFLRLLPQDSPSLEHLPLMTTLFDCTKCHRLGAGLHIENALSHRCYDYSYRHEHRGNFTSAASASTFYSKAGNPWDSGYAKYEYSARLSALVREVVIGCGENPDTITVREMNRKHHRFACFSGSVSVLNWSEAVSSGARSLDHPMSHLRCAVTRLNTSVVPEVCRVGFYDLTNYRNMYPNRRTKGMYGVAFIAGGRGISTAANGVINGSAPSKTILLIRKSLPT